MLIHISTKYFTSPVGDAANSLSIFMMIPFKSFGNLSNAQNLYNRKVSTARQTVERAIGHLKGRFRKLRDLYCMRVDACCYVATTIEITTTIEIIISIVVENEFQT